MNKFLTQMEIDASEKDQTRICSSTLVKSVPHNEINQRNVEIEVLTSGEEEVTNNAPLSIYPECFTHPLPQATLI